MAAKPGFCRESRVFRDSKCVCNVNTQVDRRVSQASQVSQTQPPDVGGSRAAANGVAADRMRGVSSMTPAREQITSARWPADRRKRLGGSESPTDGEVGRRVAALG